MNQPILDAVLAMPPKPVARLTAALMGKGRRCRACGHPTGPSCHTCGNSRVNAVARPDSDHGHKQWKRLLTDRLSLEWWGKPKLNGPLRVTLAFVIARPGKRPVPPKKVQRNKVKVPNPRLAAGDFIVSPEDWARGERVWCPRTPDLDRLTNAVFDGCTFVGVWHDDSQAVTWGRGTGKWYAALGEGPSIRLRVEAA